TALQLAQQRCPTSVPVADLPASHSQPMAGRAGRRRYYGHRRGWIAPPWSCQKHVFYLVRAVGLEPTRRCHRGILSPLRLPVPPRPRRCFIKAFWLPATNVFQNAVDVFQNGAKPVHFASLTRVNARITLASAS